MGTSQIEVYQIQLTRIESPCVVAFHPWMRDGEAKLTHRGEVRAEEPLLDAGPECEWDDEELEGLLHVLVRRLEELHPGQLLPPLVPVELAVPGWCEGGGIGFEIWTGNN